MTDQPHTPTATQIREDYAHLRYHFADGWSIGEERVQFDNWLTAEIAAAEQRGAIAVQLCLADDTMVHHEQTDDFPCTNCLEKAAHAMSNRTDQMEEPASKRDEVGEEIRQTYIDSSFQYWREAGELFDNWLAEVRAEALREAAESKDLIDHMYANLLVNQPIQAPAAVRATAAYLHNRADRMEG